MKIVHLLYELKFSGAEVMYVDAAPLLQENGYALTVMATAPNLGEYAPRFQQAGYRVVHKPYPRGCDIGARFRFLKWFLHFLRSGDYDVVHIHVNAFLWVMSFYTRIAGKQPVYTFHNVFPSHWYSYPYHLWRRWSAKKLFGCKFQSISDSVHEHELKYFHNKTVKIYNWYGTRRFFLPQEGERAAVRKQLEIPEDALVLISIGGCSHIKRHSDIIRALPLILDHIPSIVYLHLGEGNTEADEEKLANELQVADHVRFMGNCTEVRKFLIASDIYLMTSTHEGISITTIEAMACGIPTILYDVAGLRDFNKNGENSILIPEDYRILAHKVVELHSNPEISQRLAASAKTYVDKVFLMERNVLEIIKLYKKKL